jgi:glutamate/tyrosine decarboxylase-like PLP-dependent enzyme
MAAACGDLVKVREAAITLVEAIAEAQPQLHARCEETARDIKDGIRQLKSVQDILEQTANIVAEVLDQTDTDVRRTALAMHASRVGGEVAQLLSALAAVRSPQAWKLQEPLIEDQPRQELGHDITADPGS